MRARHSPRLAFVAGAALVVALGPAPRAGAVDAAPPPHLTVELVPRQITVGDPVTATLRLELPAADAGRPVDFPQLGDHWGDAVVLSPPTESAPPRHGSDAAPTGGTRSWVLRLTAYRTGKVALPPLRVELAGDPPVALTTPHGLALEVRSVLSGQADDQRPAPPAPPRPLPVPVAFWWTAAGFAAAIALAAALVARRRAGPATAVAPRSPIAELERALAELGADAVVAHAGLSLALRRYLGRRLGFPAAESTTTEIARGLGSRGLETAIPRRTRRLLGACDGVKFARHAATADELAERRDEAHAIAREVESALAPAETAEATEA